MMHRKRKPGDPYDVQLQNHGSLWIVMPKTRLALSWLEDNTQGTWWAGGLVVEPRYVTGLVEGMMLEGFTVEGM